MEFKFTTRSQEAVTAAAEKAVELGNPQISSMHLLWALAGQADGIARAALESVGADPRDVIRRAEQAVQQRNPRRGQTPADGAGRLRPHRRPASRRS